MSRPAFVVIPRWNGAYIYSLWNLVDFVHWYRLNCIDRFAFLPAHIVDSLSQTIDAAKWLMFS
jgi:hypothetical protein